jgi:hypothetical protein
MPEKACARRFIGRRRSATAEDLGRAIVSEERHFTNAIRLVERPGADEGMSLFDARLSPVWNEPPFARNRRANRRG